MDTGALTVSGTGSFGTVISTNQITSLGGFLAKGTTAGFGLYNGSSFPFLVDGSGNTTTQNLTAQGTTSLQNVTCTGETDTGNLTCATLTCTSLRNSGSFSATTSFQTFYTFTNPGRGFVTVNSNGPGMCMGFFEWTTSWPSLTLLATSYNAQQGSLNTPGTSSAGTQALFIQQNGVTGQIQVKVSSNTTVQWAVLLW